MEWFAGNGRHVFILRGLIRSIQFAGETMVVRVKTGIQGLDNALKGGIPEANLVLIAGGAGTGKSTLAMQYLVNGAELFGEKGLYISTEQNEAELLKAAAQFNWNVQGLQAKGLVKVSYMDVIEGDNYLKRMSDLVQAFKPKRLVVDSLSTLTDSMMISDMRKDSAFSIAQIADTVSPIPKTEQLLTKIFLYHLIGELKAFNATAFLTSELHEGTHTLSADGVSEFITDGVITLEYLPVGQSVFRTLRVRKMRYSDHEKGSLNYEMGDKGIVVGGQDIKFI